MIASVSFSLNSTTTLREHTGQSPSPTMGFRGWEWVVIKREERSEE